MFSFTEERWDSIIAKALAGEAQWIPIPKGATQSSVDVERGRIQAAALRQARPIEILTLYKDGTPQFLVRLYSA